MIALPKGDISVIYYNPDFLAFRCVQCSIGLADVNVKKYHRKMKIDIEQPGSNTWFFLYPKAIFFCVLKVINILASFAKCLCGNYILHLGENIVYTFFECCT